MTSHLRTRLILVCALLLGFVTAAQAAPPRVPHVFVFDQTLGFHHLSIAKAEQVLRSLARDGRFTLEITQDPKRLNAAALRRSDVVLWLSNTAAAGRVSPFTDAQERAYGRWMSCGGGHVGVHAAVDAYDDKAFPEYVEANGAIFTAHPITATSALDDQDKEHEGWGEPEHELLVVDQRSPITAPWHGRSSFRIREELYQLDRDPAKKVSDYRLLLAHGELTDPQAMVTSQLYPGPYAERAPIAWTGSYRHKNRTFYTNLGHSVVAWDNGDFQRHLVNGILWTAAHHVNKPCLSRRP